MAEYRIERDSSITSEEAANEAAKRIVSKRKGPVLVSAQSAEKKTMPSPTPAQQHDPLFEAIWQTIKSWDVNVPEYYEGYCGANGSHVLLILEAVKDALGRE